MSTAEQHPRVISYQASNKVPSTKDVRAYITRKVKSHTAAAAEARKGGEGIKAAILTINNVVCASTVVCDGKEVALRDLDDRELDRMFAACEARPFFG
jgi:hypothetical protein